MSIFAVLFSMTASASPDCDPLSNADLTARIHASLDAIQRADVAGHQAIVQDLKTRLACLEFVPSSERWAELLIGIAIVEYADKGNWQDPLTTALNVHPSVDRLVGPTHEMYSWEAPPKPKSTGQSIPDGVRIYLDGELLTQVPRTPGLHLAQRRTGEGWTTLLLRNAKIPDGWFDEPSLLARRGMSRELNLSLIAGMGSLSQAVDGSGTYLTSTNQRGMALGADVSASIGLTTGPGLYVDATLPTLVGTGGLSAHGGLGWVLGPVEVQAGAGIQQVLATANDTKQSGLLPFPTLGTNVGVGPMRLVLHGGLGSGMMRGQLGAGAILGPGFTAGLEVLAVHSQWVQTGQNRNLEADQLTAGVSLGWQLGDRD